MQYLGIALALITLHLVVEKLPNKYIEFVAKWL